MRKRRKGARVKQVFRLAHNEARRRALEAVKTAQDGQIVTVADPTRSLEQNAYLWRVLGCFSEQLQWPVNGAMTYLSPDEWKDIVSSAFRQQQPRIAQGLSGGMVMLGQRTSKFDKREFSEFIEFLNAIAVERGVDLRAAA